MKTIHEVSCMHLLRQQGVSIRQMARDLKVSRNTVRRYVRANAAQKGLRRQKASALDLFRDWVAGHAEAYEYNAIRLFNELQAIGYQGGYEPVKRFVRQLRPVRGRASFMRVETGPGQQAQVDWGEFRGVMIGDQKRTVSFLAMILSWSRDLEGIWTFRQDLLTLQRAHLRVFSRWRGIPKRLRYDNMRSVVQSGQGPKARWNPAFLTFAQACGFVPEACHVRSPFEKGKVESSIRYVRHHFFPGRTFRSLEDLQHQFDVWNNDVARPRCHGTTQERVMDRLEKEQAVLSPLPEVLPEPLELALAKVYKDCHFSFQGNRYSAPHRYAGQEVRIQADEQTVEVYSGSHLIARHPRATSGTGRHVTQDGHYQGLWDTASSRRRLAPWPEVAIEQRTLKTYHALAETTP